MENKMIGIVGGIGSYAGIDLIKKIYDLTDAKTDQDHLPISLVSVPHKIVDRTIFLMGKTSINPGIAISEVIDLLISNGSKVIGIPCNTAHAKPIYSIIEANIPNSCVLVHLIDEVGIFLSEKFPSVKKVGVLGTNGTISSNIYPDILSKYKIEVVQPSIEVQQTLVHASIFDVNYGIKSNSNPVNPVARKQLLKAVSQLLSQGAEAIILGCTEIPLAIDEKQIEGIAIIDATQVLAEALIRESKRTNAIHKV